MRAHEELLSLDSRLLKEVPQKGNEIQIKSISQPCKLPEKDPTCQSPNTVMNICLVDPYSSVPAKPCAEADVDPEWERTEKGPPAGPRIVIVGAGLAGLTAAKRLVTAGHTNLIVLEADCRAGGRLRTRWAGDSVVELGFERGKKKACCWNQPLLKIGLCDGFFDPPAAGDPTCGLLDNDIPLPVLFRAYTAITGLFLEELCRKSPRGYKGVRIEQAGRTMPSTEKSNASRVMAALVSLMGPKLKVVEDGFGAYVVAPGGAKVPLGESGMLIPLLETIGRDNVLYRKEVVSVRWGTVTMSQLPRAIVRCNDGSEYPCEFVIISSSLGSLKNNMSTMFYPSLPSKKALAIEKLCFIQENKAFLVFDEPIWTWSTKPIDIKIVNENKNKESENKKLEEKGKTKEEHHKVSIKEGSQEDQSKERERKNEQKNTDVPCWSKGIMDIKQVEGSQKVIVVTVTGEYAIQMERSTKSAVIEILHAILQDKLGIGDIPKPKDVIRSNWSDSRYFRGERSSPGNRELRADLAEPLPRPDQLPPVLLFAGEATSINYNPLQAAVISGLREAERLIAILHSLPKPMKDLCPKICK